MLVHALLLYAYSLLLSALFSLRNRLKVGVSKRAVEQLRGKMAGWNKREARRLLRRQQQRNKKQRKTYM